MICSYEVLREDGCVPSSCENSGLVGINLSKMLKSIISLDIQLSFHRYGPCFTVYCMCHIQSYREAYFLSFCWWIRNSDGKINPDFSE